MFCKDKTKYWESAKEDFRVFNIGGEWICRIGWATEILRFRDLESI